MVCVCVTACILARWSYGRWWADDPGSIDLRLNEGLYRVERVVDGDTLVIRHKTSSSASAGVSSAVRVGLIGVDSPPMREPVPGADVLRTQATEFTERFLSKHAVRLQFDKRRIDEEGRYLAYVFVDSQLLNEALVRAGLACVVTRPGDSLSMARRLQAAEQNAREAKRGIWAVE